VADDLKAKLNVPDQALATYMRKTITILCDVVDGWQKKCEGIEAENAQLKAEVARLSAASDDSMNEQIQRYDATLERSNIGGYVWFNDHRRIVNKLKSALSQRPADPAWISAAQALVDAMETCHQCRGTVLVDHGPVHCEDCSYDCDNHDYPECESIYELHRRLKAALASSVPKEKE